MQDNKQPQKPKRKKRDFWLLDPPADIRAEMSQLKKRLKLNRTATISVAIRRLGKLLASNPELVSEIEEEYVQDETRRRLKDRRKRK